MNSEKNLPQHISSPRQFLGIDGGRSPAEYSQTLAWTGRLLAEALRKSVAPNVGAGALQRDEASMSAGDVPKTRSDSPISGSFPEAGDVPVFYHGIFVKETGREIM